MDQALTVKEAKEQRLSLPEITHFNDKPLRGNIKVVDKHKEVHFNQEFHTRLMRKKLHDFLSECYEAKLKTEGGMFLLPFTKIKIQ